MDLINLTPHVINVVDAGGNEIVSIPPSGDVARLSVSNEKIAEENGIEIFRTQFGTVEGLPEAKYGTRFIVSALVRSGNPDRSDLLSPGELVRDEAGKPIGCRGLVSN